MKRYNTVPSRHPLADPGTLVRFALTLPKKMRLYYRLLRDRRVPGYLKGMVLMALLYVLSPFDFIPDFVLPGFGFVDDILLLLFVLQLMVKMCPKRIVMEHMARMAGGSTSS